jgi:hypothetical protein
MSTDPPPKAAAAKFNDVQRDVADLIKDKVIVGHCLWNDLSGTYLWHHVSGHNCKRV